MNRKETGRFSPTHDVRRPADRQLPSADRSTPAAPQPERERRPADVVQKGTR